MMLKKDIKSGMVIEDLTGRRSVVIGRMLIGTTAALTLDSYKDNLKYDSKDSAYRKLDIVRVYNMNGEAIEGSIIHDTLELVWERK